MKKQGECLYTEIDEYICKLVCNRTLKITVIGVGYVGLPTAVLFADRGFKVFGVDINEKIVEKVNNGKSHINEPGLDSLLLNNELAGRFRATSNISAALRESDAVLVCVQTPIDSDKKPNLTYLLSAFENVGRSLRRGMLVSVCSTVPPGTTTNKIKTLLEELSGLKCEQDFYLAYVPERIAPGKALTELVENTRLVGGVGPKSTRVAAELFRAVCKDVRETTSINAEISKLVENTYRDINIAFANQLALICEDYGADVKQVVELANTHPRVNVHTPGPGVGGPCLTKDPYLLVHGLEPAHRTLVDSSRTINDYMPKHVASLTLRALAPLGMSLDGRRVLVLGTAYKANVDDPRESPSRVIISELKRLGAMVVAYDPYCNESFGAEKSEGLLEGAKGADCLVVATDHSVFKSLDLAALKKVMRNRIIVDARRIIDPKDAKAEGFSYHGLGMAD